MNTFCPARAPITTRYVIEYPDQIVHRAAAKAAALRESLTLVVGGA